MIKEMKRLLLAILCVTCIYGMFPAMAEADTSNLSVDWSSAERLNVNTITSANLDKVQPSYAADESGLYAAWAEADGSHTEIKVKKYDGTAWTSIDGGGLNINGYNAADPFLVIYSGRLYLGLREEYVATNDGKYGFYVMRYNGGTSWTRIDGGGTSGMSYASSRNTGNIYLSVHGNYLYAAWDEGYTGSPYHIHVSRYDSSTDSWNYVDGGTESGINQNPIHKAQHPFLISYQGKLYAAWDEYDSSNKAQIMVKSCDVDSAAGTYSWNSISGDTETGINFSPSASANTPKLFIMKDTLYAAWTESGMVKVSSFSASGTWSTAINLTLGGVVPGDFDIAVYNNRLYSVYLRLSPSKTFVSKYDGENITNLYEGSNGFISSTTDNNINPPSIGVYNHKLYLSWLEGTASGGYNIISRSLTLPHIVASAAGLTEGGLKDASISLDIQGTSFLDTVYDKSNFILSNAPSGLSIESVVDNSGVCTVNLDYNGKDFDQDITDFGITVRAGETAIGEALTDTLTITADNDPEVLSITDGDFNEGEEDGSIITVAITGGIFADTLNPGNWTVANLPEGVTKGSVTRINDSTVQIALSGNSSTYTRGDITNVTVSCTSDEYVDSTGGDTLTAASGVIIRTRTCDVSVLLTGNGSVELNSAAVGIPYQDKFKLGTEITLVANAAPGNHFAYWLDTASNSIISTSISYSFTAGTDTGLRAVFQSDTAGSYNVLFKDPLGKVLDTQKVNSGENAVAPADPYIIGYQFIGWDKSLKKISSDTVITAQFKRLDTTYRLTVINGTISAGGTEGDYKYDTQVTLNANAAAGGQKFAYWTLNGVIISRSASFNFFTVMDTMTLEAVYEADSASTSGDPLIALLPTAASGTDGQSLHFIANRDVVPAGCTLLESGILLFSGSAGPSGELTLDTAGVIAAKAKNTSTNQFFVRRNGVSPGETWYARAYMIYLNTATGKITVVYSTNTVSKAIT